MEKIAELPGFSKYIIYSSGEIVSKKTGNPIYKDWGGRERKRYHFARLCSDQGTKRKLAWHRVIWMAFNGEIPEGYQIDHRNRNQLDNRLENLRCVSVYVNQRNRSFSGEKPFSVNDPIEVPARPEDNW